MLFIKNSEYNETFNNTFFIEHLKHKQTLTHTHTHTHTHTYRNQFFIKRHTEKVKLNKKRKRNLTKE